MPDVADLLRRSRAANTEFHEANQAGYDHAAQRALIVTALTLRREADAADPPHADPAWADDKAPHPEIVAFYERYLGIVPPVVV